MAVGEMHCRLGKVVGMQKRDDVSIYLGRRIPNWRQGPICRYLRAYLYLLFPMDFSRFLTRPSCSKYVHIAVGKIDDFARSSPRSVRSMLIAEGLFLASRI